ncbi:MAG: hypothetical protein ACOX7F_07870 [Eubacteriales bacterium]|jgi:uridine kinase
MTYQQLPARLRVVVSALRTKQNRGEDPEMVLQQYTRLTEEEKNQVLEVLQGV